MCRAPFAIVRMAMLGAILAAASATAQDRDTGCVGRSCRPSATPVARTDLVNWTIQSSATTPQSGDAISKPGFDTHSWYAASVPTTVLNAQVNDALFPDPTYDINFQKLPGALYDSGDNFLIDPPP